MCWMTTIGAFILVCYLLDCIKSVFKVKGYSSKYVLITGCDSGFGQALAIHLESLGFPVFAGCLTAAGKNYLKEKCSSRLIPFLLDVTDEDSIQQAFDFVQKNVPKNADLWAIVNNAGIRGTLGSIEMCTKQDFIDVVNVNLFGTIDMCRKFLPLIRKCQGRVVNMSSIAGRICIGSGPYAVSKYGIEGFTDRLRLEMWQHRVGVSIIEPGCVITNVMEKKAIDRDLIEPFQRASEEIQKAYGEASVQMNIGMYDCFRRLFSPNVSHVVNAYTHAITARFPHTRYVVGWDSLLAFRPISLVPSALGDVLILVYVICAFVLSKIKQLVKG